VATESTATIASGATLGELHDASPASRVARGRIGDSPSTLAGSPFIVDQVRQTSGAHRGLDTTAPPVARSSHQTRLEREAARPRFGACATNCPRPSPCIHLDSQSPGGTRRRRRAMSVPDRRRKCSTTR
jgi:hypothetical protein